MGIKHFLAVGLALVLVWGAALFIALCSQLTRAIKNWIHGTQVPVEPNPVLTRTLGLLGVSGRDRLTCSVWIINALMLWPITLIVAIPLVSAFRAQERRQVKSGHEIQQPAILATSENLLLDVPTSRTSVIQAVPS